MRRLLLCFLLLAAPAVSFAGTQGRHSCADSGTVVDAQGMDSSQTFSESTVPGWTKAIFYFDLTDANTSITRLDLACTVSNDGNISDFTTTVCDDTGDGVCTLTLVTGWQLASPGTSKWVVPFVLGDSPAYECTVSVGAGTGASADVLTVERQLCTD